MDDQSPQVNSKKLYLGNLSWGLSEADVRELCEAFGEVVDCKLITDPQSGRSRGFAFVEFAEEDAAKQAMSELHEKEVDGRNMFVKVAQPKKPRRDDDRGGRGGYRGGNRGGNDRGRGGYGQRN